MTFDLGLQVGDLPQIDRDLMVLVLSEKLAGTQDNGVEEPV